MPKRHVYEFKIDAFTPDTLPMSRLAEYMADLAAILGDLDRVHFVRMASGSAVLVHEIEDDALPRVRDRVQSVRRGQGPADAMKAFDQANKRLKQDNAVGTLSEAGDAEIIRFPGRDMPEPVTFGAFNQEGTLDGKVILVGGRSDPVPVHIQQGRTIYNCQAKRDIASALGRHLFQSELRVRGEGRWSREADGTWTLLRFTIHSFEILEDEPLSAVVGRLREISGSGWVDRDDPWSEIMDLRRQDDEAH